MQASIPILCSACRLIRSERSAPGGECIQALSYPPVVAVDPLPRRFSWSHMYITQSASCTFLTSNCYHFLLIVYAGYNKSISMAYCSRGRFPWWHFVLCMEVQPGRGYRRRQGELSPLPWSTLVPFMFGLDKCAAGCRSDLRRTRWEHSRPLRREPSSTSTSPARAVLNYGCTRSTFRDGSRKWHMKLHLFSFCC